MKLITDSQHWGTKPGSDALYTSMFPAALEQHISIELKLRRKRKTDLYASMFAILTC